MPVDPHLFATFIGITTVMSITPGPANLFAIATGAERGAVAALLAALGMNAATLVWFVAAGSGLSAVIAAAPQVFHVIALIGAGYVAWLGLQAIAAGLKASAEVSAPPNPPPPGLALRQAFMVQITNPKALLYFTVVLPPFLDPARPMAAQLGLFAVVAIGIDASAMCAYGLLGGGLRNAMVRPGPRRVFSLASGALLLLASALIFERAASS